jgi:RNA-directed DNA polymerase
MGRFSQFIERRLPGEGRTTEELARWVRLDEEAFKAFQPSYRTFTIAKRRRGGWRNKKLRRTSIQKKRESAQERFGRSRSAIAPNDTPHPTRPPVGKRTINAPDAKTKAIQRTILRRLLQNLPIHDAATGFRRGRSIVDNARPHTNKDIVIRMDVRDFFPSITEKRVYQFFQRIGWNRPASRWLARTCTFVGRLPQGAPTSPAISNLICYKLDSNLASLAASYNADYTRYADDVTFSVSDEDWRRSRAFQTCYEPDGTNKRHRMRINPCTGAHYTNQNQSSAPPKGIPREVVKDVLHFLRSMIEEHGFKIRGSKTRVLRRHQRQTVTGLVVNDKVNLKRNVRRKLRAARHRVENGKEPTFTPEQLEGWNGIERMVEEQRDG